MIPDLRCVWCGQLILDRKNTDDDLSVRYIVRADPKTIDDPNAHVGDVRIAWHWKCACEDPCHEDMANADADYFRAKNQEEKAEALKKQLRTSLTIVERIDERFSDLIGRRVLASMRSRK